MHQFLKYIFWNKKKVKLPTFVIYPIWWKDTIMDLSSEGSEICIQKLLRAMKASGRTEL